MHERRHRRSIRLPGYDYSSPGTYFVTVCTKSREQLFGEIVDGEMFLNDAGLIAKATWEEQTQHYLGIELDAFQVMPNHVHGIIVVGATFMAPDAPSRTTFMAPDAPSRTTFMAPDAPAGATLGEIVRGFKARVSIGVNQLRGTSGVPVWQRNYYEHIVRGEDSLTRIRRYILENPSNWRLDPENPLVVKRK